MADAPENAPFDARKAIEQSAAKSTLQELARRGIHRVKVLDDAMVQKLIRDAVAHVMASKSDAMSAADREKVVAASRQELDKLMKEFQQNKDKSELLTKDKEALASEVENLQKQLQIQRQLSDTLGRQRYEDGRAAAAQEISELKTKLSQAEELAKSSGGDAVKKREAELRVKFGDYEKQLKAEADKKFAEGVASQKPVIEQMKLRMEEQARTGGADAVKAAVDRRENELKVRFADYEKDLKAAAEKKYQEGVASQQGLIEQLKARAEESAQRAVQQKEAEYSQKVMAEMQKNVELSQKLTKTLEDMRTRDDEIAKKMEQLFTKSIEGLSKKLGDMKYVSGPGGGGGGGGGNVDISFRQSEDVLKSLLSNELESNVKNMEKTEGKVAGNLGSALERLKAMRGGPPKPPEKKKEDEEKK
jgi:DNA repair exonuclease SbcCD ATPase subunit